MDVDKPPDDIINYDDFDNVIDRRIIINSLLCYCSNKFKTGDKKKLLSTMCSFFGANQVRDAKNLLLSQIKILCPN